MPCAVLQCRTDPARGRLPRPRRTLVAVLAALLFMAGSVALAIPFVQAGLQCEVRVLDPASGLVHVRMRIPTSIVPRGYLDMGFLPARQRPGALRSFAAREDGRFLNVVEPDPRRPYIKRIEIPKTAGVVQVDYTLDPIYYPPGMDHDPAEARSRVTSALGVLRTSALFPRFELSGLDAEVRLALPPGWVAVTPWRDMGAGFYLSAAEFEATDYLAVGPFHVLDIDVGDASVRVAVPDGATDGATGVGDMVRRLVRQASRVMKAPVPRAGRMSVIVVPPRFMRGGSAGTRSVVQPASPAVLAHEIMHWWNSEALTKDEAAWFREGFSEYYGLKVARGAGLLAAPDVTDCLADMAGEMRWLESVRPFALGDVSLAFDEPHARRLVYTKGALYAHLLDQRLAAVDRSLDEVLREAAAEERTGLGNGDLRGMFHRVYGGFADPSFDAYVFRGERLPDLGLPRGSGTSGCARYGR